MNDTDDRGKKNSLFTSLGIWIRQIIHHINYRNILWSPARVSWKRIQGKARGIRQTQRQKRSKGRLASLFPHRCCWTRKQGWTESGPIYKSLGFHLLRPSTSNSGRAWDNLSSCRSHQGPPRGDFYKAPHISYRLHDKKRCLRKIQWFLVFGCQPVLLESRAGSIMTPRVAIPR